MRKSVTRNQIKALALAMSGASVAAVATMFVPASMLEGFTGATGLSELVPAAAAPLGDTARAIIAFGAGAFTLAFLAYILLRQENVPNAGAANATPQNTQGAASFKDRLARIALPKMPWKKGEDDITELGDLPKLRNHDSHPDAPPRRPLSAHQDLPVLELGEVTAAIPEADIDMANGIAPIAILDREPVAVPEPIILAPVAAAPMTQSEIQPTLAEMVAQLEAAVADRQSQLAELEAVAAQLGAGPAASGQASSLQAGAKAPPPEMARIDRPPLAAVPPSVKDDDMDSALAAALATLHRMNGTDR